MAKRAFAPAFERVVRRLDRASFHRVQKLITKILRQPTIGKPMRHQRKGTREVYLRPFRLAYSYDQSVDTITFLDLYHKKEQ